MVELSNKRVEQILHEETQKTEQLSTILRAVYTRYMRLYEQYFADVDALDDDRIAELKQYHEETKSLVKHYYMDIPQYICLELSEFDKKYSAKLLGSDWRKTVFDSYKEFKDSVKGGEKTEESLKAEFSEKVLEAFYGAMDFVFREGFGTGSKTAESFVSGLRDLLFG